MCGDHTPVFIHDEEISQVSSRRYLSIHVDNLLAGKPCGLSVFWSTAQSVFSTWSQGVCRGSEDHVSVLPGCFREYHKVWDISVFKSKLARVLHTAMKVMGRTGNLSLQSVYEQSVLRQAQKVSDPSRILHCEYELYRIPKCKLNQFKNSSVPISIKILNNIVFLICMGCAIVPWCCLLYFLILIFLSVHFILSFYLL